MREIRLRLNVPADSPEWGMYLILATPILEFEAQIAETITKTVRTEVASALKTVPAATVGRKRDRLRWPLSVAAVAGGLLLLAFGSFSGAVAQRTLDVTQRLVPPRAAIHVPWVVSAQATIATWPVFPFVVATTILLVLTVILGVRKSGPAYRKIFP